MAGHARALPGDAVLLGHGWDESGWARQLPPTAEELARAAESEAAKVKAALARAGLPVLESETHIVPVMVCEPEACKAATDRLLEKHAIYIQPINYPTVPRGLERLRITPGPLHTDAHIRDLTTALVEVWTALGLPLAAQPMAAE